MIFAKILVLVFSVSAIPTKYESKTKEPDLLDAKALTTGELVTQTRYKNQTIEKNSNTSSEIDQNGESYQNTFDRIGWRRRMTDWGDLDTLRALSIVQVRPPQILNSHPSAWQLIAKRYKKRLNRTQHSGIFKIFPKTPPEI